MKVQGILRKVDDLGRIVFPAEYRKLFGISEGDSVEIFANAAYIYFKKHDPTCNYCGEIKDTKYYKGKLICSSCLAELKKL